MTEVVAMNGVGGRGDGGGEMAVGSVGCGLFIVTGVIRTAW